MNAYLAEVMKKREEECRRAGALERARSIALSLLNDGVGTLEQIAKSTGLGLAEVKRLAYVRE